jgi:hypothetical protein
MGLLSEVLMPATEMPSDNGSWFLIFLGTFMATLGYIATFVGIVGPLRGQFAYVICLLVGPYYFLFKGIRLLLLTATRLNE